MTGAVLDARDLIVRRTQEMTKVYRPGAFMTRKVDARTMDKYLMGITAEQLADIALRDPDTAERYAGRINLLEKRAEARPRLPAESGYEPEV